MSRSTRSSRRRKGSGAAGTFLSIFVIALGLAGLGAWFVLTPYGPASEHLIRIAPGSSTPRIGRELEQAGIVRNRYAFDLLRIILRGTLQAGEYRFDHPAPVTEVYSRIARGDVYTVALTVPEGADVFAVAARAQQAGLCTREAFFKAVLGQTALIADLDPQARSLEGYLFPDTYRFSPPVSPVQMVQTMVRRFRSVARRLGMTGDIHRVVTLASLVERETAVPSERPLVASVFTNRLAKNMPLMSDPAVIYGLELEGRWRGVIYKSDLARDTAYNDYLHAGLPPGPIANPGAPSLEAALHPAKTDYLYFVAADKNPQGHSLFSSTLDEQIRNVAAYRNAVKRAGAQ